MFILYEESMKKEVADRFEDPLIEIGDGPAMSPACRNVV